MLMKKWEGSSKLLKRSSGQVEQALADRSAVDPAHHSYAFIHLLVARLEVALELHQQQQQHRGGGGGTGASPALPPSLLLHCHDLFSSFSPLQVSYCLLELFHLSELCARVAVALHRPSAPLLSFSVALQRLHSLFPHALTPLHAHFVHLSVLSKHYHYALPALRLPLYSTRPRSDGMDALLYLTFHYHAGLVWLVYRQWSRAVEAFHLCLAAPGNAVSAIQVAAYKKLILAHLMDTGEVGHTETHTGNAQGCSARALHTHSDRCACRSPVCASVLLLLLLLLLKAPTLPARVTSPALLRHLEPLVQPYLDLAKAFARSINPATSIATASHSMSATSTLTTSSSSTVASSTSSAPSTSSKEAADLASLHAQHLDLFNRDRNSGLVKQLSTHSLHLQVQRLTSTYLTLPLAALATLVRSPPASVEQWLSLLIVRGRITARIDARMGLVEFSDAARGGAGEEEAEEGEEDGDLDLLRAIDGQIEQLLALRQRARASTAALSTSPIYIAKALQSEKEEAAGGGGGGGLGARGPLSSDVARASLMRGQRGGGAASEEEQIRMAMQQSLTEQ